MSLTLFVLRDHHLFFTRLLLPKSLCMQLGDLQWIGICKTLLSCVVSCHQGISKIMGISY